MLALVLRWLGGPIASALSDAYKAKLSAQNEEQRLVADAVIADIQRQAEAARTAAGVVQSGMQYNVFWVAWLIAAVPTAAWYAWGMLDSMIYAGTVLPDVAALPPQLKEYADIVFANIFYAGAGAAGVQAIAASIRGRR